MRKKTALVQLCAAYITIAREWDDAEDDLIKELCAYLHEKGAKEQFANKLGISPPHLSDILHGRRSLTMDLAERIAKIV